MSDATTLSRNEYVAAFFDNEADAEAAVARIAAEGIPRDQIRMVAGNADTGIEADHDSRRNPARRASSGRWPTSSCRRTTATPTPKA